MQDGDPRVRDVLASFFVQCKKVESPFLFTVYGEDNNRDIRLEDIRVYSKCLVLGQRMVLDRDQHEDHAAVTETY